MNSELLNVVNESDEVIGTATRAEIHKKGLLHREISVWFITPNKEIIFQKRSPSVDTNPNLLTSTVSGHVEIGDTYQETAVKEALEETGLHITASDLKLFKKLRTNSKDSVTATINNTFKVIFLYSFKGKLEELIPEKGKGEGFEKWPISTMLFLSKEQKTKFIATLVNPQFIAMYQELMN